MDRAMFYWTPIDEEHEQDIIAFLPDEPANPGNIMSYMHVGQHGEASIAFMRDCIPAALEDYRDLKAELKYIGYELED